eukprot:917965-Karenia_brevis.AAC.1
MWCQSKTRPSMWDQPKRSQRRSAASRRPVGASQKLVQGYMGHVEDQSQTIWASRRLCGEDHLGPVEDHLGQPETGQS